MCPNGHCLFPKGNYFHLEKLDSQRNAIHGATEAAVGLHDQSAITIAKQTLCSGIATLFENLQKPSKILDEVLAANNGNNVRELCLVPRVK